MTLVEQILEDALLRRNYVVVPGVGAFMANNAPSEILLGGQKVYPPAKKVVFNPKLNANDVFLRNQLCKSSGLDVLLAEEEVRIFAEGIQSKLNEGLMVSVGRLGYLYVNNEGETTFNNNTEINWNLESYGLPALKCVPVALRKTTERRQDAIVIQLNTDTKGSATATKANWRKLFSRALPAAAAAAAIVITGGLVYWASLNSTFQILEQEAPASIVSISASPVVPGAAKVEAAVENKVNETPEMAPNALPEGNVSAPNPETIPAPTPTITTVLPTDAVAQVEKLPVPSPERVSTVNNTALVQGRFVVIAGSFTQKINAEIQAVKYAAQGFETEILPDPASGFFRVGIQRFMTKEGARAFITQEASDFTEQIWVLSE